MHSTRFPPFHLAFGPEVVLPTEIMVPTTITQAVQDIMNNKTHEKELTLIDDIRWIALLHVIKYQEEIKRIYDKRIKHRVFKRGDWVLKKVVRLYKQGNLENNWKAPYIIDKVA